MATITLDNSSLKKYLDLFRSFDLSSRKKLVEGLNETMKEPIDNNIDKITALFGAWEDGRDSDKIVEDIKSARTNNPDIEAF